MTARDFAYWLQGYFEINGRREPLTPEQTEIIWRHLSMVFAHEIDPQAGSAHHQEALSALHLGGPTVNGITPRC